MGFANDSSKKKYAIVGVSSLILVAMCVAVAIGAGNGNGNATSESPAAGSGEISTSNKAVKALCQPTQYQETCVKSLESAGNTTDPKELVKAGFNTAIKEVTEAIKNSNTLKEVAKDPIAQKAVDACGELMDYAIDDLKRSLDCVGDFDVTKLDQYVMDLRSWLSAANTMRQTCLDNFENTTGDAGEKMKKLLKTSGELLSNGLDMVTQFSTILANLGIAGLTSANRRLLSKSDSIDGFPSWVSEGQRRLLVASPATIKADVVVAKDGSGKYKAFNQALKDVPENNTKTFVIYVKEGVYAEHVHILKNMTNVMVIGDGPTKTRFTGSLNKVDGVLTFKTATFGINGWHFMAKDVGFENTAGAIKEQAVALRVQAEFAVFYNCHMDGYQDTLYTHAYRQFYRDCTISGTIDFIFGDGQAVFQNCKTICRQPLERQSECIILAQGRTQETDPGAIVLHNCTITAAPEYDKTLNKGYLGRPWKEYSRHIIVNSQIDDFIDPEGWRPWMGNYALKTCFFAEFGNRGPGADTKGRVTWPGYKKTFKAEDAARFAPGSYLLADQWLPQTGVPFNPNF